MDDDLTDGYETDVDPELSEEEAHADLVDRVRVYYAHFMDEQTLQDLPKRSDLQLMELLSAPPYNVKKYNEALAAIVPSQQFSTRELDENLPLFDPAMAAPLAAPGAGQSALRMVLILLVVAVGVAAFVLFR